MNTTLCVYVLTCQTNILTCFYNQAIIGIIVFQIYLPTGTRVVTSRNGWSPSWLNFMNVQIYPSLNDINVTSGLCGDFDGDKTNDGEVVNNWLTDASLAPHRYNKQTDADSLIKSHQYLNLHLEYALYGVNGMAFHFYS